MCDAFDPVARVQNLAVRLTGKCDDPGDLAPCGGLVKQMGRHVSVIPAGLNAALRCAERMIGVLECDINRHTRAELLDALISAVELATLARDVYAADTAEGTLL